MIQCFLRIPKFPIVCDAGGSLIGASSLQDFSAQVATLDLLPDKSFPVVDASSKSWAFLTSYNVLTPLTDKQGWTKKEVITMFNGSGAANKLDRQYSERSLSAKRFDRILTDIVELIQTANQIGER